MKSVLGIAAVLLMAGCGGGGANIDSASAVGKAIGCESELRTDWDTLAQEEKQCDVGGEEVSIIRFANREAATTTAEFGSSFGVNYAMVNDNWAIASQSRDLVKRLAAENDWEML